VNKLKAYKDILKVLDKHSEVVKGDHRIDISSQIRDRIKLQEISKEFGININADASPNWIKLSEFSSIGVYGAASGMSISWSDDGTQPESERLYVISFPTGAYIFGQDYPTGTFKAFFQELKDFGAAYTDTANSTLYFKSDAASKVHSSFNDLFKKYRLLVGEESKNKRIIALKLELDKLQETPEV